MSSAAAFRVESVKWICIVPVMRLSKVLCMVTMGEILSALLVNVHGIDSLVFMVQCPRRDKREMFLPYP